MFRHEVPVQEDGLNVREHRIVAVEVVPAGLDEAGPVIGEQIRQRLLQEVRRGHEIGVKDRDERCVRHLEPRPEGPGLEPAAVRPVDPANVEPGGRTLFQDPVGDLPGVVGGVVEQLHAQPRPGIVEGGYRPDQPLDDVPLVEDRELDENRRRVRIEERGAADPEPFRGRRGPGGVAGQPVHQHIAVRAVDREQQQDDEIGRQNGVGERQGSAL